MSLLNRNFLTPDGTPITGRTPTQIIVNSDQQLTPQQRALVEHTYKLFCDNVRLSPAANGYHVRNQQLPDGTRIRMESNNSVDRVMVWPEGREEPLYVPFPAFRIDEGEKKSATWNNLPWITDRTLKYTKGFRADQPGNRTWFDARKHSQKYGLVLSWWGLGDGRYNAWSNRTIDSTAYRDYYKVWCNGHLLVDLPPEDGRIVVGACLIDAASAPTNSMTLCVVTAPFYEHSFGGASGLPNQLMYGQYASFVDTLELHTLHAPVNRDRLRNQTQKKLVLGDTLLEVATCTVGDYAGNPLGIYEMTGSIQMGAIYFNASGTEGAFASTFRDIASWSYTYEWQLGMMFSPITGQVTGWAPRGNFAIPWDHTPFVETEHYQTSAIYDYIEDELVFLLHKWVAYNGSGPTYHEVHSLEHSKYGILHSWDLPWFYSATLGGVTTMTTGWAYGDLRSGFITDTMFYQYRSGYTDRTKRVKRLLAKSGTDITELGENVETLAVFPNMTFLDGYYGIDSSYDGSMSVEVGEYGVVRAFAHKAQITTEVVVEPTITWPVLCGPQPYKEQGEKWDKIVYAKEPTP